MHYKTTPRVKNLRAWFKFGISIDRTYGADRATKNKAG